MKDRKDKKDENVGGPENDATSAEPGFSPERRKALIVGSLLVPTIITLYGTPAWAATDYSMTAYRYGDHTGLCRNPDFDPYASSDDDEGPEFVSCGSGQQGSDDEFDDHHGFKGIDF